MTQIKRRSIICILLALLPAGFTGIRAATGTRTAVGGWFSSKGSGLVFLFSHSDGTYGELRVSADFDQVLNGRESFPGFRAQYGYNMRLATVTISDELKIRPVAGPGITVGYVRDHEKGMGILAALDGNVGLEFIFPASPLSIYAGISAEVGAHIVLRNRYESTMTLYDNGLRRIWQPELSVRYRF